MKFAFCPYCGHKLDEDFAFCPKCGKRLNNDGGAETSANATEQTDDLFGGALGGASSRNDFSALGNMLDEEIERKNESDKKHRLIRVLCAREKFDEATELCNELIEADPEDLAAYIGFIRIESKDFGFFEGESIDKAIKVAQKIYGINNDLAKADNELAAYFTNREKYFAEKQQVEEERKAKETAVLVAAQKAAEELKAKEAAIEKERNSKEKFEIKGSTLIKYNKKDYTGWVSIPHYYNGNFITVIGDDAFKDCKLTSVSIDNGIISIGNSAFFNCGSLTDIEMPNSVTSIGALAFASCWLLTDIKIPESVTSIGNYAFSGCDRLTHLKIPKSITKVGEQPFRYCRSLRDITYEGSSNEWKNINGYKNVKKCVYCKGDGVTIED